MTRPPAADLLRGMLVEPQPFRLARGATATRPVADAQTAESSRELSIQQGYQEGLQLGKSEGLLQGYEEGLRQAQEVVASQAQDAAERAVTQALVPVREQEQKARALLAALEVAERTRLAGLEEELVALAYQVACAVIGAQAVDPPTVRTYLTHLVSNLEAGPDITLHLHPQDAASMDALRSAEAPSGPGHPGVRWVADAEVAMGGCLVVRDGGGLDLRLETALERCKEVLLEVRAARRVRMEEQP